MDTSPSSELNPVSSHWDRHQDRTHASGALRRDRRPFLIPHRWDVALVAALVSLGVIIWEHVLHVSALGDHDTFAGHLNHAVRDGVLIFPLAMLAVWAGLAFSRRMRLTADTWPQLLGRAAIVSLTLAVLMVPSVGAHGLIDNALSSQGVALAHDEAQGRAGHELAGHVLATHNHGLEHATSVYGLAEHGVRDAIVGQAVALPLIVIGLALVAFLYGAWPQREEQAPRKPQSKVARRALKLSPMAAILLALVVPGSGWWTSSGSTPSLAAGADPCPTAPQRSYTVSAINLTITYNRFGDNDPGAFMYVLDQNITAVQAQAAAALPGRDSIGLREDPIQPLVIRANLGDCLTINFTNRLTQGPLDSRGRGTPAPSTSIHAHGLPYQITSAGSSVGFNPDTMVAPGASTTYRYYIDPSVGEGAKVFHSHGDSRQLQAHGLFGTINVEPTGSTWLDPQTAQPLTTSNWEAIIQMPGGSSQPSFREFTIIYHEVGDESFNLNDSSGRQLPQNDPITTVYRPGTRAINYRSEPFFDRLTLEQQLGFTVDESQGYGSYMFGDPATPIPRSYLGEPTKTRLVHGGSEQAHVHHLHGGGDRWRANPGSDPGNDISGGLEKNPDQNATSIRLDSQTISPMESYTLEHECGAGGCQQAAGDFLFHCHIAMHYVGGMWSFWRVFDTLQPDLAVIPGRGAAPAVVDSSGLIGKVIEGKTIVPQSQLTDPTTQQALEPWVEGQLPPQGVPIDAQDPTVWNWQKQGTSNAPVYYGEPDDTNCTPDSCPQTNGARPKILFNPNNGRYAWPLFQPHFGHRPPFSPRGHTGAPWLGNTATATHPDGLCPSTAPVDTFNITAITLPIKETAKDTDPNGAIFVLNEDKAAVLAGIKPAKPLAIRSNVGDCVAITLSSQLVDNTENGNHSKVNMHTHFVQFDPQASDGVITGRSFEQSVRPFPTENRTLSAAAAIGATQITVTSTSRLVNGVYIAVGQGQADIEIDQITAISGTTLTLATPLGQAHASGEPVGTEFVQYRWFSDVDAGTVFWHDHVDGIHSWGHGLFGAHIIEPAGSTYHDPQTGAAVRSGDIVDIWTPSTASVGTGQQGSFREFMIWLHNDLRGTGAPPGCEQPSINLRAEPFNERAPNNLVQNDQTGSVSNSQISFQQCPAISSTNDPYIFSSVAHGDPFTPLPRAYVGDPFVIRTIGLVERVEDLRVTGHRFRRERFNANGELLDAATTGISERFDYILDGGAGGPAGKPGDYLYYSGRNIELEGGGWGILRVHDTLKSDLEVLPGRTSPPTGAGFPQLTFTGAAPPAASSPGNPCPSGANAPPAINVSVFSQPLPLDGNADSSGVIYALSSDEAAIKAGTKPTTPLVIRANQGDCVQIALKNDLSSSRAGLSAGKILFDPQGSYGAAIGFDPDSTVAPGATYTYKFYVDQELGTSIFLNLGNESTLAHGAYGALIAEPTGSSYVDPVTGGSLASGLQANILNSSGNFREFVALMHDTDPQIGRSIMRYSSDVQTGSSSLNYRAAPLDARLRVNSDPSLVFNSAVQGDPPTTIMKALVGDPVRFRAAIPFSANVHVFFVEGHEWPWEPLMSGSQVLEARTLMSGESLDARLIGGAGGQLGVAGDYLYGDHRMPFLRAGIWGIFRVCTSSSSIVPLRTPVAPLLAPASSFSFRTSTSTFRTSTSTAQATSTNTPQTTNTPTPTAGGGTATATPTATPTGNGC